MKQIKFMLVAILAGMLAFTQYSCSDDESTGTAPTINSLTLTSVGKSTAVIRWGTSGAGTLYGVILKGDNNATPSTTDLVAQTVTDAIASFSIEMPALDSIVGERLITDLEQFESYQAFIVMESASGEFTGVTSMTFKTTDDPYGVKTLIGDYTGVLIQGGNTYNVPMSVTIDESVEAGNGLIIHGITAGIWGYTWDLPMPVTINVTTGKMAVEAGAYAGTHGDWGYYIYSYKGGWVGWDGYVDAQRRLIFPGSGGGKAYWYQYSDTNGWGSYYLGVSSIIMTRVQ